MIFAEFAEYWKVRKFKDLTSVFLGFAERFFTDGKCDPQHTPTAKSCLLRVPYTINTKYNNNQEVKLILKWNYASDTKPNVRYVLRDFKDYLCDNRARVRREEVEQRLKLKLKLNKKNKKSSDSDLKYSKCKTSDRYTTATTTTATTTTTPWIECLLQIGIDDYRKRATNLILAPYLLHKKRLEYEEAAQVIRSWLVDKCQPVKELDFNPERKIKEALSYSQQNKILHMRFDTLKNSNPELYNQLLERMGKRMIVH